MDTKQLERATHEFMLEKLLNWKEKYNITIQIYLGDYNIFIDKPKLEGGEVSLYNKGGYETIWQAINEAVNWLEEKNPVRDGQNLIMGQPVKSQSGNGKLPIFDVSKSLVCGRFKISEHPPIPDTDPNSLKNVIWMENDEGEGTTIDVERLFKWAM